MNIQKNVKNPIYLVGYDINKNAIRKAKEEFYLENSFFFYNLNHLIINQILKNQKSLFFDLVIFDRVFFLFDEEHIKKHLCEYSKYYKFVILDDFHNEISTVKYGSYITKNYKKLFSEFDLISISKSEHKVNGDFFRENAKRIIFKNKKI